MNPLTQSIMALVQDTSLSLPQMAERIEALVTPAAQPQGAVDAADDFPDNCSVSSRKVHAACDAIARQTEAANAVIAELVGYLEKIVKTHEDEPFDGHDGRSIAINTGMTKLSDIAEVALTRARAYQNGQPAAAPAGWLPIEQYNGPKDIYTSVLVGRYKPFAQMWMAEFANGFWCGHSSAVHYAPNLNQPTHYYPVPLLAAPAQNGGA